MEQKVDIRCDKIMKVDEAPDENDVQDDAGIAAHRPLHRFMVNLLDEASVGPLQAFLVQDNASTLMKSASVSARAAYRKFSLGHRDHFITKEISRWESYPFEVETPIAVVKPKKAKNGCVPQRRAKRSGLESAVQIKAEILKKSEAIPQPPRRRLSAVTDDLQKSNMQEELLRLFEQMDSEEANIDGQSAAGTNRNTAPKRDKWSIPKKPMRRLSEVPNDLSSINQQSPKPSNTKNKSIQDLLMSTGGSQHSTASTETTLSEIGVRNSDLSSASSSEKPLNVLLEYPSLDCSVIMEEEDGREHGAEVIPKIESRGSLQSVPKKPVRRVSEVSENLIDTIDGDSLCSASSESTFQSTSMELKVSFNPPVTDEPPFADEHGPISATSHETTASVSNRVGIVDGIRHSVVDSNIQASNSISVPKMPMRRPNEVPQGVSNIHENCKQPPLSNATTNGATGDAHYSFSTESTASETTVASDFSSSEDTLRHLTPVETPTLDCSAILEEEDDHELDCGEQQVDSSNSNMIDHN